MLVRKDLKISWHAKKISGPNGPGDTYLDIVISIHILIKIISKNYN